MADTGYREIVLSGINLGRWGRDFQPQQKFEQLIRALLEHTEIEKIRISSVQMDWSDDLIALVAGSPRIAKHAHVPLQSGSDQHPADHGNAPPVALCGQNQENS